MKTTFPFEYIGKNKFGKIFRPHTYIYVFKKDLGIFIKRVMIVDTGADFTIFPRRDVDLFGIDIDKETVKDQILGIGGEETIFLYEGLKVKLGDVEFTIPCGFLDRNDVPALLGRQQFMELLKVSFQNHETLFMK